MTLGILFKHPMLSDLCIPVPTEIVQNLLVRSNHIYTCTETSDNGLLNINERSGSKMNCTYTVSSLPVTEVESGR